MVKPAVLYASETLIYRKSDMEEMLKKERKIIGSILGPRISDDGYRSQKNETVQKLSNIEDDIRK